MNTPISVDVLLFQNDVGTVIEAAAIARNGEQIGVTVSGVHPYRRELVCANTEFAIWKGELVRVGGPDGPAIFRKAVKIRSFQTFMPDAVTARRTYADIVHGVGGCGHPACGLFMDTIDEFEEMAFAVAFSEIAGHGIGDLEEA